MLVENPNAHPVTLDISFATPEGLFIPIEICRATMLARQHPRLLQRRQSTSNPTTSPPSIRGQRRQTWSASAPCTATTAPGPPTPSAPRPPPPPGTWPKGCTGEGFETWVLVQNPGDAAVTVDLTLMTSAGELTPGRPAGREPSRPTPAAPSTWATTSPTTTSPPWSTPPAPVVAERAMYGNGPRLGPRLHRHHRPRRHLVPGRGLHRRGLRDLGAGAEPRATAAVTVDLTLMTSTGELKPGRPCRT